MRGSRGDRVPPFFCDRIQRILSSASWKQGRLIRETLIFPFNRSPRSDFVIELDLPVMILLYLSMGNSEDWTNMPERFRSGSWGGGFRVPGFRGSGFRGKLIGVVTVHHPVDRQELLHGAD